MTLDVGKAGQWVDVLIKVEIHAFMMLIAGVFLILKGHKDEGMLVLGSAMAVFKGNRT